MTLLTAAEIQSMRTEVRATLLVMTCAIERLSSSGRDAYNHPVTTWAPHLADVPCYWWTEGRAEELLGPNVNAAIAKQHVVMPAGTDVTTADRITVVTGAFGETLAGPLHIRAVHKRLVETVCDVEAQVSA